MKAIKTIVHRHKIANLFNIPESYGEEVQVIILPADCQKEDSLDHHDTKMMRMQEKRGFLPSVLGDEAEDVWNDL